MLRERKAVQVVATEALTPPAAERAAAIPEERTSASRRPPGHAQRPLLSHRSALLTPSIDVSTLVTSGARHGRPRDDTDVSTSSSQLPLVERYVTIACVSNEVGGNLVGNAKWTGVTG